MLYNVFSLSLVMAHSCRQIFHCQVDINNITESFNNVLCRRYLPLQHDTTIFALVQILIEVAFKEQETKYNQSISQQSQAYRKPRYNIPSYLGRPQKVQRHILLNMERAKTIPKSHTTESDTGVYDMNHQPLHRPLFVVVVLILFTVTYSSCHVM